MEEVDVPVDTRIRRHCSLTFKHNYIKLFKLNINVFTKKPLLSYTGYIKIFCPINILKYKLFCISKPSSKCCQTHNIYSLHLSNFFKQEWEGWNCKTFIITFIVDYRRHIWRHVKSFYISSNGMTVINHKGNCKFCKSIKNKHLICYNFQIH